MEILEGLWNTHVYYKGSRINMFGVPKPWKPDKKYKDNSFNNTILRLKKKGLIEKIKRKWVLTEKGKEYFENKNKLYVKFHSPFPLNSPKNLLLMFDIPESKRTKRNWLRWHLREFQYHMIQQSVWVGPSPLPKKFKEHAKNIGLDKFVKTFKLSKPYQIDKNKGQI
jgi:DNA-binding transcriptional regulator PaaX